MVRQYSGSPRYRHLSAAIQPLSGQVNRAVTSSVSRHFVTVGRHQVHYRLAGTGPVVLLLHQTPTSSFELLPLIRKLAPRFTVIAPDMPGYGASDPLAEQPLTIEALADNVACFMDMLGVTSAAVYGYHTGASVATRLARRHPLRVAVAICEGLLCLDPSERREFLSSYIEPFVPRWDGSHLAWLWTRLKDQSLFFPWYERTGTARLDLNGASPEVLETKSRDWLRSGERYSHGYAAAISYDPIADLTDITTAHHVLCHRSDPLAAHLARLPSLPLNFESHSFGTAEEGMELVLRILDKYAGGASAPKLVPSYPDETSVLPVSQHYVTSMGAQLRVLRGGTPGRRATVIQHDARSSLRAVAQLVAELSRTRFTLAIELPGHGETDPCGECDLDSLEQLASSSKGVLEALGVASCDFIGIGAGAAIQTELAVAWPRLAGSLTMIAPIDVTADPGLQSRLIASYQPMTVDSYGGYLLRAWHEVRDHLLFFPWYERRRAFAVLDSPLLEAAFLQSRTVELLLAGNSGIALRRAEAEYPLLKRLARLPVKPRFAAPAWEPRFAHVKSLAATGYEFVHLPRDAGVWAQELG